MIPGIESFRENTEDIGRDNMKRICSLITLICLALTMLPSQPAMAASNVGLFLDGKPLIGDVPPVIINNRTLVPLRVVGESLGASVNWISNSAPIVIRRGADEISLKVGVRTATLNGATLTLDVPPQIISGHTMVPFRFIGEGLGAGVNWVASPPGVYIISPIGSLSQAVVQYSNGKASALTFTSSKSISLGQASTTNSGANYTVTIENTVAQAEQMSFSGPTGLMSYSVVPSSDNTTVITLNLGNDSAFRTPLAELSADGKTLTFSWPFTMKQAQFVRTGGVEYLSFDVPAGIRPELTDTLVELSDAGTLQGSITEKVGAYLRKGPSVVDTEKIMLLALNTPVTVIGETTGWYQVRLSDNTEGWVSDILVGVKCTITEPVGVNVRIGPGTNIDGNPIYPKITTVYPGHQVTVLERKTGWYRVNYGGSQTGWIADYLVPLTSVLVQPTTVPGLKLTFPGVDRACQLAGDIRESVHIASLTWQDDNSGTTAIIQLKHAVGYKLTAVGDGWRLTFGTWVTALKLISDQDGTMVRVSLDGQSQPTVAYAADRQAVMVTVANATLAENVPASLSGDGRLVAKAQVNQVGSDVRVTVTLARQLAYHLNKVNDTTWEVIFSTPTLVGKTVALDPGHGAADPGAMGTKGLNEAGYTADIIARLRTLLGAAGANVVMTREIQSPSIEAHGRAALINQSGADLFLSVHINAYTNPTVHGLETFYYPRNDNERFARLVQGALVSSLGWPDRGVKSNTLYILTRESLTTGALAEIGFITNAQDESLLYQSDGRQKIAESLYRAIESYFAD